MAVIPDKPYGLGVLDHFEKLEIGLAKIRSALAGTPDVTTARAEVNDLIRRFRKSKKEANTAQKQIERIVKTLRKGWIEET